MRATPPVRYPRRPIGWVPPQEVYRRTLGRIKKAERDERVDITMALTPVKTYMGGFTKPRDIRASNWFPGGAYLTRGKIYERPAVEAYEPYTVYLLETRHLIRYGLGRPWVNEHVVGMCRTAAFPALLRRMNRAPQYFRETLDNAVWPFDKAYGRKKKQRWWNDVGELVSMGLMRQPAKRMEEVEGEREGEEGEERMEDGDGDEEDIADDDDIVVPLRPGGTKSRNTMWKMRHLTAVDPGVSYQEAVRAAAELDERVSAATAESTSEEPVGDSNEAPQVAPAISAESPTSDAEQPASTTPIEEEPSPPPASPSSSASILDSPPPSSPETPSNPEHTTSSGLPPTTPSSFPQVIKRTFSTSLSRLFAPTAITLFPRYPRGPPDMGVFARPAPPHQPSSARGPFAAPEDTSVFKQAPAGHGDGPGPEKDSWAAIEASTNKPAWADAVYSDRRHEPAPAVERRATVVLDSARKDKHGVIQVKHLTDEQIAEYVKLRAAGVKDLPLIYVPPVKRVLNRLILAEERRAARVALGGDDQEKEGQPELRARRQKYGELLKQAPFFRPLLAMTFPTRPIAASILRLSKSHPRGLPFYASVSSDDRKHAASFNGRMREMRLQRMRGLCMDTVRRLQGYRGGFVGLRLRPDDLGRAINGESLEWEFTGTIPVLLGAWFPRADEQLAIWKDEEGSDGCTFQKMDEYGYALDDEGKRVLFDETDITEEEMVKIREESDAETGEHEEEVKEEDKEEEEEEEEEEENDKATKVENENGAAEKAAEQDPALASIPGETEMVQTTKGRKGPSTLRATRVEREVQRESVAQVFQQREQQRLAELKNKQLAAGTRSTRRRRS